MERRKLELSALILMLISVLAVVVLVANLDDTDLGGNDGSSQEVVDDIINGLQPIALVLVGVLFIYVVTSVIRNRARKRGPGQKDSGSSLIPLIVLMVMLGFAALVLFLAGPMQGNWIIDGGNTTDGSNTDTGEGSEDATTYNMYTLIGVLVFVVIIMIPLVRYLKGQGAFTREVRTPFGPNEQVEVLDQAILDIGSDLGDLRETILRAYQDMCRLIPSAVDHTTLTPREFAEISVRELKWPERAVGGLTEVFELARYSHHPLSEEDRSKALHCLAEIKEKLTSEVTKAVGAGEPVKG
jgi:ABC-type cobalt transport system substrate-binding protein